VRAPIVAVSIHKKRGRRKAILGTMRVYFWIIFSISHFRQSDPSPTEKEEEFLTGLSCAPTENFGCVETHLKLQKCAPESGGLIRMDL
jgi:hypothetical protein